ncbi:hypothetical protein PMI16_04818 [Herbaspirillum sp. CF444]|uniref:hypothetical protein n=1 Tax=Herbaspirillum sp. CF444 TaxID=1144319 RepID=UPI000272468E|nr:hypothetical protein [Herbaspirillum sp. CF444]EJL81212.1 hypothetical protein PMI16_04818 [Herbaspirillum sp. CF444]
MSNAWCHLQYRYGNSLGAPTRDEIMVAVKELYEENLPDMTEDDYDEHGAASLRYGFDDGPMYVLEITRLGTARWSEWADADFQKELCPTREIKSLSQEKAFLLWEQLGAGETDLVRMHFQTA